jgi:hypothetical protein
LYTGLSDNVELADGVAAAEPVSRKDEPQAEGSLIGGQSENRENKKPKQSRRIDAEDWTACLTLALCFCGLQQFSGV